MAVDLNAIQSHVQAGRLEAAEALCRQWLAQSPEDPFLLHALGFVLNHRGDVQAAEQFVRQAIARRGEAMFYNTLGVILAAKNELDGADEALNTAVRIEPRMHPAYFNIAEFALRRNRQDYAIENLLRATSLYGREPAYFITLAAALARQGRIEEVLGACRQAIAAAPNRADVYHHLLYYMWFAPGLRRDEIVEEQVKWGERFGVSVPDKVGPSPLPFHPAISAATGALGEGERAIPGEGVRLRVGYVSPDLRNHPIGYFMAPILAAHDRKAVEVFCYFHGQQQALTEELEKNSDHWIETQRMTDDQLSHRIREDRIDVLIDLSLHMAHSRLLLFSRRSAPVQATYLSYPGTSGLGQMDYRITDRWVEPEDRVDGWLGPEKLARLEGCYWCYRPPREAPELGPVPSVENGFVTFACTNNFMKVNAQTVGLWARILQQIADSRLRVFLRGGEANNRPVVQMFEDAGIPGQRVHIVDQLAYADYLGAYNDVDIALDCFPYNGGTTTFDSLYMGVPVISLVGELPVSRFGFTILGNLGLEDLVAWSADEYVERAVALAGNLGRRKELRQSLRARLLGSHLTNPAVFTRQLEALYRWMFRRWCLDCSGKS